jgi:phosphate transport system protein
MPGTEHTLTRFDDNLKLIHSSVLEMGKLVEQQVSQSLLAFFESNAVIAREVIDRDYSVRQLESQIDDLSVTALARLQPTASDLKTVVFALKVAVQLECIGGDARRIARFAERLTQHNGVPRQRIHSLRIAAELAQQKLSEVIASFARLDKFTAYKLLSTEELVAEATHLVFEDLIRIMRDDPRALSSSLDLLLASKAIEHMGSHIKDISRLVVDASNRYSEIEAASSQELSGAPAAGNDAPQE